MNPDPQHGTGRETIPAVTIPSAIAAAVLAAIALAPWQAAIAADLALTVANVSDGGTVQIAVYGNAADYRKKAVTELKVPAAAPAVSITIPGLPAGDYAIAVMHDRNGNDQLDSNLFGVPTEPYGFSNNPRSLMGPATWEQTRFALPAGGGKTTIELND
ncbi:MAG: DUF2141 domain-containing protein [Lautropia sp.]